MRINRILLATPLVIVAMVLQVSVLARLHLPGAVPDLLLMVVLGLALVHGCVGGCLVGFFAGLLADLAPPSDHAVGRYALVLCVVGYVAGLFAADARRQQQRTVVLPLLVVIGAAVVSTLLYAGVGALVGDTAARNVGLSGLMLSAALYDLVLAPFVLPVVMALARRTENDPLAGERGSTAGTGLEATSPLSAGNWLTTSAGFKSSRGRMPRQGRSLGLGGRGGLLGRSARAKAGRIKGVKRL
ncbi:rod shape-determining protein MreD [Streptomyces sp. NPDC059740]|uniref:rod shape-determining protein MreD n=1 Tax=Streptomyces sp. NPDC059740 TaxID=3346926 RepID=UPI0036507564